MKNVHRFYFAQGEKLIELIGQLENKGYMQLPDGGDELTKLIIDTALKHFWLVDQKRFEAQIPIIKHRHNEFLSVLEPDDIEKL